MNAIPYFIFIFVETILQETMNKHPYERPVSEAIDLEPLLDVCNNLSPQGNTDGFSTTDSSSGWEDEFSD